MTHAMKEIYFVFHRANTHKSRFLTLDVLMPYRTSFDFYLGDYKGYAIIGMRHIKTAMDDRQIIKHMLSLE